MQKGVCNCATHVPGLENRDREIYYAGGRDGSRVLMKWNSQFSNSQNFGGYAAVSDPLASITLAGTTQNFQTKHPFSLSRAFGRRAYGLPTQRH